MMVIALKQCSITYSTLVDSLNYIGGESVYAKVVAVNYYGESNQSSEGNGALFTKEPNQPVSLANDLSVTTASTQGLTWSAPSHDGGDSIIDYRVNQRVQGDASYSVIATGVVGTSHTIETLTLGTTYELTVEANNNNGYSLPSDPIVILHAIAPE